MKRNLLSFFLLLLSAGLSAQTTTYSGNLQNGDPVFNRPNEGTPPSSFSAFQNVRYDVYAIPITSTGLITVSVSSSFDNFAILYDPSGFLPAIPLTNALIANDDFIGQNAGFSYDITVTGTYYLVVTSYKNNISGAYTATVTTGAVLPLKLVSFNAVRSTDSKNLLKWTSSEELNLSYYQVQKSTNNIVFEDLVNGKIMASNNPLGSSYQFFDPSSATENQFYRLKIVEKSGLVSYSPIALIKQTAASISITAFPNPAINFLQLEMKSMQGKQANITVTNAMGILVLSGDYRFSNFSNLKLYVGGLPAGNYFLKVQGYESEAVVPFVKK